MPVKNTKILADKDYTPPEPPTPAKPLTVAQKNKVKARITSILKNGPGLKNALGVDIPGGPMETWKVTHFTCHKSRKLDGVPTLTTAQVAEVISEMKEAEDFAPGYDGTRDPKEVVTPE
jgi:hypothetical protein